MRSFGESNSFDECKEKDLRTRFGRNILEYLASLLRDDRLEETGTDCQYAISNCTGIWYILELL